MGAADASMQHIARVTIDKPSATPANPGLSPVRSFLQALMAKSGSWELGDYGLFATAGL